MRRGFIFDHDLCVRCNACSAACILENKWNEIPRTIYQINTDALLSIPVINLSLACNHCEKPVCLTGCPVGAFYKEGITGAVLINEKKCLGCNYCTWNCPYDAIKPDSLQKVVVKCHLCHSLLTEGGNPACSSACPTGALHYGSIPDNADTSRYPWFPEKKINPSLELKGNPGQNPLRIVPETIFNNEISSGMDRRKSIGEEWSLAAFSFLSTISVALMFSWFLTGSIQKKFLILVLLILSGLVSLLHLGKKVRAWRVMFNIPTSPLSREIAAYIVYLLMSAAAVISESGGLIIASSVAGLIMLITIDSVYSFPDRRMKFLFHSGQTFLTGLLLGSFFSGMIVSFLFIGGIKLVSGILYLISDKDYPGVFAFRFLRLALLLTAIITKTIGIIDPVIAWLFLSGELIDRILYYYDFKPVNINTTISGYIKSYLNEKKGD